MESDNKSNKITFERFSKNTKKELYEKYTDLIEHNSTLVDRITQNNRIIGEQDVEIELNSETIYNLRTKIKILNIVNFVLLFIVVILTIILIIF